MLSILEAGAEVAQRKAAADACVALEAALTAICEDWMGAWKGMGVVGAPFPADFTSAQARRDAAGRLARADGLDEPTAKAWADLVDRLFKEGLSRVRITGLNGMPEPNGQGVSRVRITGLKGRPELNDQHGLLEEMCLGRPGAERWSVRMDGTGRMVKVRPQNLRIAITVL